MKTAIITGPTSGIGLASAFKVVELGYDHLILIARNSQKLEKVRLDLLEKQPEIKVTIKVCDLADFDQVKDTAISLKSELNGSGIDLFVNNAGIGQFHRVENKQGFEMNLAVNYLSQVILTEHLIPHLNQNAFVIFVSSMAYRVASIDYDDINLKHNFSLIRGYGNSKAYQMVYSRQLQKRFENDSRNLHFESVHPGVVRTHWGREDSSVFFKILFNLFGVFQISPEYSASHNVLSILNKENKEHLGKSDIWIKGKPKLVKSRFMEKENSDKLWEFTKKALEGYLVI